VVDPGRSSIATKTALCYIYPVTSTPETRGYVCQDFITPQSLKNLISCRGRDRTSTEQLVVAQSSVVDPGRSSIATKTALCYIYPVTSTPETRGHVCHAKPSKACQRFLRLPKRLPVFPFTVLNITSLYIWHVGI